MSKRSANAWKLAQDFMRTRAGVVLDDDQDYLLNARLQPVASELGFPDVPALVERACRGHASSPEAKAVLDALTTHETYFFREQAFWKAFKQEILPKLFAGGQRPLRIWSAACSTGQEAYSFAILLSELAPGVAKDCEIFATDISQPVIHKAREGRYSSFEVNRGVSGARLVRHFRQCTGGFRVRTQVRRRVRWDEHNLFERLPSNAGRFDLILCRNVLIYFSREDRQRVEDHLLAHLAPGGFVGLGCAERSAGSRLSSVSPGWYRQL